MKKILISLVFLLSTWHITDAGVVPGTIQKIGYTTSNTCNTSVNNYSPSSGSCYSGSCKTPGPYTCNCGNAVPDTCNNSKPAVPCTKQYNASGSLIGCTGGSAAVPDTCNNSKPDTKNCYCGCSAYYHLPTTSGTLSFTNYLLNNNNPTFASWGGGVKLSNDLSQSCNRWANGTNHIPPSQSGQISCNDGAKSYYQGGANGYCDKMGSKDNLITIFDQIGTISRTYPTDNDASCTVEGRYATSDTTAPTASINGVGNVFVSDDTKWCNIEKYRGEGYTYKADENPGCEFYKGKNTHIGVGQGDLLKGLEITVPGDPSGIGEIQVVLGKCSYTYTPDTIALSNILVSTTSPSGVKSTYKDAFTLRYNTAVTALGKSQPSLLSAFGKSRLDECLEEGKNSIAILIKDMAVSETDGKTASPNTGTKFTKGTINIDNSTSKLQLSGDLTTTSLVAGTTIDGVTGQDIWRNYTIGGNVKAGEIYKGGKENKCSSFSGSLTGQCSGTLSGGRIWIAPSGVQADGKFMQFKCDNLGPFPDNSECQMGCPNGQTWNPNTNSCGVTTNLCKAFVGGAEVVIEDGINGVVSGSTCMAYCIPGHSVSCVVKP